MHVKSIELRDFRNYTDQRVEFCNGINLITGGNGEGKTNLVEAIYISSFGRSFRTTRDSEIIRFDSPLYRVNVSFSAMGRNQTIDISYNRSKEKRIRINGVPIGKMQELIGEMNIVLFSPEDMRLVKDSPGERRRFLDREISSISKQYYGKIVEFNRILEQRNNLLKTIAATGKGAETIGVWDVKFAEVSSYIMTKRHEFIGLLNREASEINLRMTKDKEFLEIKYNSSCGFCEESDKLIECILSKLEKNLKNDIYRGHTTSGPHKDDISFILNGKDLKSYGSQGQKRTAVLAVKIAQTKMIKDIKGEYPVLLLDDVLSELDLSRQIDVLDYASNIQTIITSAELSDEIVRCFEKKMNDDENFEYRKFFVKDSRVF